MPKVITEGVNLPMVFINTDVISSVSVYVLHSKEQNLHLELTNYFCVTLRVICFTVKYENRVRAVFILPTLWFELKARVLIFGKMEHKTKAGD